MKTAIIHDWLVTVGGAERVLEEILAIYPDADVFSTVCFLDESQFRPLQGRKVTTSFVQKLPGARKHYRSYLPLMPLAIEQWDMTGYDLVVSSSYAVAKGVITGPNQVHVSYVHSPIRYAWDLHATYLEEAGLQKGVKSFLARILMHYIRLWDTRTANGVDAFLANSHFIARRIRKAYSRESKIIYPPVNTDYFRAGAEKEEFYLTASRMVPYKKVPLIAQAFAEMPDRKLVVIGDGPEMDRVRALKYPNIEILGYQPNDVLRDYMQRAKALVFAAEEDFGITPLEAQACGTPVLAYGRGGSLETVRGPDRSQPTGMFFDEQNVEAIRRCVDAFEERAADFTPGNCRLNALRFSQDQFRRQFKAAVDDTLERSAMRHPTDAADGVPVVVKRPMAVSTFSDRRT